jgi:hypothetical protein
VIANGYKILVGKHEETRQLRRSRGRLENNIGPKIDLKEI